MMDILTVATRGTDLGLAQTEIVTSSLKKLHPDIKIRIKTVTTKGDRNKRTVLWKLKDTGFFTSQVEDALLAKQAHFAVHSFKDLPTKMRNGLIIPAICHRQYVNDCLIASKPVSSSDEIQPSAKIGTSSLRRIAQLKRLRPDLQILPIRGNIQTRIKKLANAHYDAIILAKAGLERLGLDSGISFCFDPTQFIPAAAQGALAVQCRTDQPEIYKLLSSIDDNEARITTLTERWVLSTMKCGCHAPAGAFAKLEKNVIKIHAFISDLEGRNFIKRQITGPAAHADNLAEQIANDLLSTGGREILKHLTKPSMSP
jgi:hydroxymethylbilane synthase